MFLFQTLLVPATLPRQNFPANQESGRRKEVGR
jgi:hypothetical protein